MDTFPWGWVILLVVLGGATVYVVQALREQAAAWDKLRKQLQVAANLARRELVAATRDLPKDPGEPYTTQIALAKQHVDRGTTLAEQARKHTLPTVDSLRWLPGWSLILVFPAMYELVLRLLFRFHLWQADRWVGQATTALEELRRTLVRISRLGRDEKLALAAARQHTAQVAEQMKSNRHAYALSDQIARLDAITEKLDQVGELMADANPQMEAVVRAYPLRLQAEQELESIQDSIVSHQKYQAKHRPQFHQARQRLSEYVAALEEEAEKAYPILGLRASAAALESRLTAMEGLLTGGSYALFESSLKEFNSLLVEQEKRFEKLLKARQAADDLYEKSRAEIDALRQWLKDCPAQYEMDVSQSHLADLEIQVGKLTRLQQSEDAEAFHQVKFISFDMIHQTQKAFERSLQEYQSLHLRHTEKTVRQMEQRAGQAVRLLEERNSSYQTAARLSVIKETVQVLHETWNNLAQNAPGRIRQSRLVELVQAYTTLDKTHTQLVDLCVKAEGIHQQLQAEHNQAMELLADAAFRDLDRIIHDGGTELGERASSIRQRHDQTNAQLSQTDENFTSLLDQSRKLCAESAKLSGEYISQLENANNHMGQLEERLKEQQAALSTQTQNTLLDFEREVYAIMPGIEAWHQRRGGMQPNSLARLSTFVNEGSDLAGNAQRMLDWIGGAVEQVNQAWKQTLRAADEAERTLGTLQQSLERSQPSGSAVGQALWQPADSINRARRLLDGLSSPRSKLPPEEVLQTITQASRLIESAQRTLQEVRQQYRQQ
jgi:hypothetical protein